MLEKILKKPESERNRLALGFSVVFSIIIFASFAFYKGYLSFGAKVPSKLQPASVVSAEKVPSPISNSKETFTNALDEIGKQYNQLKDTISAVLVPFVTGIEVYDRK